MCRGKLLLFAMIAATLRLNAQAAAPDSIQIQYTGRLFGYYRIEPGEGEAEHLKPVDQFLKMRKALNRDKRLRPLLLGMGDNFAPEMGASLQLEHLENGPCKQNANPSYSPPESLYKQSDRYAQHAECDNVVRFLLEAGYRAIVPGREDFIYSSTWLHQIGVGMRRPDVTSESTDGKLRMLAANVRVDFERSKLGCPLFFSEDLSGKENATCTSKDLPTRLDWLDRLDRVLARPNILEQVKVATARQFGSYTLLANTASTMESMLPSSEDGRWLSLRSTLSALASHDRALAALNRNPPRTGPDLRIQQCMAASIARELASALEKSSLPAQDCKKQPGTEADVRAAQAALSEVCTRIHSSVSRTSSSDGRAELKWDDELCIWGESLVQAHADRTNEALALLVPAVLEAGRNALLRAIAKEQWDTGYTEATVTENGQPKSVLIIGVAGQETMTAISRTYLDVCVSPSAGMGSCEVQGSIHGNVNVMNPVRTVQAVLRASEEVHGPYDYRILMAQMPQTEATELVARLNSTSMPSAPQLDLVLSETQSSHSSAGATMQYRRDGGRWAVTPVLTPASTYKYDDDVQREGLIRPDSTVTVTTALSNRTISNEVPERPFWSDPGDSALHLLMVAAEQANKRVPGAMSSQDLIAATGLPEALSASDCTIRSPRLEECKVSAIQFLLRSMQADSNSDLAMLQRRDIFLDMLPDGYDKYDSICVSDDTACRLRVALDRVLWKGDYTQTVMLPGKDIASMMSTAATQNSQEQNLQQQDISQQWLVTFGIVTQRARNLTRARVSSNEFSVPSDSSCNDAQEQIQPSAGGTTPYCVNGQPLQADHAYSLVVSDYLAQTQSIVPKQPDNYYSRGKGFLTETIKERILHGVRAPTETNTQLEARHQQRGLFQIDIAKVVAGYNFRAAQGGDNFIASAFQGASDARASSPSQSELDLETKVRAVWKNGRVNFGIQSDSAYDRSVQGNLTGSPVNAAYPLNNASVGGFLEWKITSQAKQPHDSPVGTLKVIAAPYQYQRQFNGSYLFFAHTDKTKGEQIRHLPAVNGFSHRAGTRWEVSSGKWFRGDKGSYYETGMQLAVLNDILSAVTLSTPGTAAQTCPANASATILSCFKTANFPITAATTLSAQHATLHSAGLYWDVHYQKTLLKLADKSAGASLIVDTKGDYFLPRDPSNTLSTQTLYDVPLSVSLAFPVLRNLSFAPTYSAFIYGNQVAKQRLFMNGFGLTARWYFDRDASVGPRQILFKGPASADETKTARIK